jgi:ATP-dependent DNA helicase RecQ
VLGELEGGGGTLSTQALEARVPLSRSRLELLLKVLDVDGAVRRVKGGWASTGLEWAYDAERYGRVAETRRAEHRAMLDYIATTACRMRFLREQLDDPADECGRCDNCTGRRTDTAVGSASLAAATDRLARPGVVLDVRSTWPGAMERLGVDLRGRIPEGERPQPGRAVARLSDLGYGQLVRAAAGPGRPDAPVPPALLEAAVKVLAAWREEWPERPGGIVAVGSTARPVLVGSLAAHLATVGKLPLLGTVEHRGPSAGERSNSAFRLKAVANAYSLGAELTGALQAGCTGKPLFLVDDLSDSGWTIAVVARLLRRAGAGPVYPLVLGQVG